MTRAEIKQARRALLPFVDRMEPLISGTGQVLSVTYRDGSQRIFYALDEVMTAVGDQSSRQVATASITPDSIRPMRERAGLSRQEFAAAVGVSVRTVEGWECSGKSPSATAKRVISGILAPASR